MNKTLIIGASTKPERYSFKAAQKLLENNYQVEMIGNREDTLFNHKINKTKVNFTNIDTVTLYLSSKYQKDYYNYLVDLHPRRVIFNPGTENEELEHLLDENHIEHERACTLVLLATNEY